MDALWERGGRKPSVPPLRVFSDPGGPRAAEPLLLKAPTSHLSVLQKKKKKHLQAKSLAYVALQLTRNS